MFAEVDSGLREEIDSGPVGRSATISGPKESESGNPESVSDLPKLPNFIFLIICLQPIDKSALVEFADRTCVEDSTGSRQQGRAFTSRQSGKTSRRVLARSVGTWGVIGVVPEY